MRCKCCDTIMDRHPGYIDVEDEWGNVFQVEEDMCYNCKGACADADDVSVSREYSQGLLTEVLSHYRHDGVTPPCKTDY